MKNKELKESIQQMRIYVGSHYELTNEIENLLIELLNQCLASENEVVQKSSGDLLMLILELDLRDISKEMQALLTEVKYKIVRLNKSNTKVIGGTDSTQIYPDKRDKDGFITDLSLMIMPYQTQRIEHRSGDILHYTEEIYIDALGRHFRKIMKGPDKEETSSSVAEEIMNNFDDSKN